MARSRGNGEKMSLMQSLAFTQSPTGRRLTKTHGRFSRALAAAVSVFLVMSVCLGVAIAGDAVDTRVTFTFADNNLLTGPDADANGSPSIPNSTPTNDNRLFFDDFERRDTGFENLSHLVLYMNEPGFFEGMETEAALVMRAQSLNLKGVSLRDDGSYLRLTQALSGDRELVVTAFPISADRFRLGYSYDISWGGNRIFKNSKAAPGIRVALKSAAFSGFIGAKTGLGLLDQEDGTIEQDTVWGVLGGAGLDVASELRLEAGGGFFQRGTIPKTELRFSTGDRLNVAPWQAFGMSAQATYHIGGEIGVPVDFRLLKNRPEMAAQQMKSVNYDSRLSFIVRSEFSFLGQTLQSPENPGTTRVQPAVAADFTAQAKIRRWRIHGLLVYRDLAFILFNVPSLTSFVDFPAGIDATPEVFAKIGVDYFIESLNLTPGVIVGVSRPASIPPAADAGNHAPLSLGQQTIVFLSENDRQPLSPGETAELAFAAKTTFKLGLSPRMTALGELSYSYNPNRRGFDQDPLGIPTRTRRDPDILGFNVMLQARF